MNSNGDWQIRVREAVYKTILIFPEKDRDRLLAVIEALPQNPYAGDIEKMRGEFHSWRRRVGSYRIFYEIKSNDKVVYVFRIERRTSKTY